MVVDECHRGYLLDREMSDAEMSFREPGRLHLEIPPRAGAFRRSQDRPDCDAGAAHRPYFRRSDLHLFLPRGRDRRLSDRSRTAGADHDRTEPGRDQIQEGRKARDSSTPAQARSIWRMHPTIFNFEVDEFNKRVVTVPFNATVARGAGRATSIQTSGKDADLRRERRPRGHRRRAGQKGFRRNAMARSRMLPSKRSRGASIG